MPRTCRMPAGRPRHGAPAAVELSVPGAVHRPGGRLSGRGLAGESAPGPPHPGKPLRPHTKLRSHLSGLSPRCTWAHTEIFLNV